MLKKLAKWYRKVNSWSVDILGIEAWTIPFFLYCWRTKTPPIPRMWKVKRR